MPPTISTCPLSPGSDKSNTGCRSPGTLLVEHELEGAVCVTAIGTNYLRLDICPKNFCQVMASWGPQVRNVATKRDVCITLLSLGNTTIRRRSSVGPRKAVWCVGTSCDFPLFMRKANLLTKKSVRLRCRSMRALNWFLRSQSRYWCIFTPCTFTLTTLVNTFGAVERPKSSTWNLYAFPSWAK